MATVSIPLQGDLSGRFTEQKDQRLVNCYVEKLNANTSVTIKRPGTALNKSFTGTEPRGITKFRDLLLLVIGDTIYDSDGNIYGTLNTSSGFVYFGNLFDVNLFISDQDNGYVLKWDGSSYSLSEVTDSNFPIPHQPGVSVQGGFVFVLTADGSVFNSNFDDPFTWDEAGFITAENYPDTGQRLITYQNYVVVLSGRSVEVFYNAAVAPPASPLKVNQQGFNNIGTQSPHAAVSIPGTILWIGVDTEGGYAIYRMDGFTPKRISNNRVDRLLEQESFDITNASAFASFMRGHSFYILQLSSMTLVYDIDTGLWSEWETNNDRFFGIDGEFYLGTHFFIGSDANLYYFDNSEPDDYNAPIDMLVQTERIDFDSIRDKFMPRLDVFADITSGSGQIRWTDDDFQTWSNPRSLDFSKHNTLYRLGKFKKRAFEISSDASVKHRWYSIDAIMQEGGLTGGTT